MFYADIGSYNAIPAGPRWMLASKVSETEFLLASSTDICLQAAAKRRVRRRRQEGCPAIRRARCCRLRRVRSVEKKSWPNSQSTTNRMTPRSEWPIKCIERGLPSTLPYCRLLYFNHPQLPRTSVFYLQGRLFLYSEQSLQCKRGTYRGPQKAGAHGRSRGSQGQQHKQ